MKKKLKKDDSIYQLSITEIAFVLSVLLVLLLSFRLNDSLKIVDSQQDKIEQLDKIISLYLGPSVLDPNSTDDLMPCNKCISYVRSIPYKDAEKYTYIGENVIKSMNKKDLTEKELYAFYEELLKSSKAISQGKKVKFVDKEDNKEKYLTLGRDLYSIWEKEKVDEKSVFEMKAKIQELATNLSKGREIVYADEDVSIKLKALKNEISELTSAEKRLKKENTDLIKTNNYLTKRAGMDLPPCWLSDEGKPQYMFSVKVSENAKSVIVNSTWPAERQEEALAMAPVQNIIKNEGKSMPLGQFVKHAREIRAIDDKNPQGACRHYIRYDGKAVTNANESRKTRIEINSSFYMYEVQ